MYITVVINNILTPCQSKARLENVFHILNLVLNTGIDIFFLRFQKSFQGI